MKSSILILVLSLLSLSAYAGHESTNTQQPKPFVVEQDYEQGQLVSFSYEAFSLHAEPGILVHDLTLHFSIEKKDQEPPMQSRMVNVTDNFVGAYRLLPNGMHFSEPALITIPYGPLPLGYRPSDVYTYYYDENIAQWKQLERVSIDTILHTISSYTTHFTDFANAIIKVPDMPESKAFVPTAMMDLPDVNPLQGVPMIAVPEANNRGTAELTYPIELPKGRQGMQPNVDLHYSSAGGNGILGVGWSLTTPAITIDTRWGVPRFEPRYESEQYLVNGAPILLRNTDGTARNLPYQSHNSQPRIRGAVRFYARDTKNQNRVIRYGNNPTNYWWAVTTPEGITTYYGRSFNPSNLTSITQSIDSNSVIRTENNCIVYWAATAMVDVNGNYVIYANEKEGENIYVSHIDYTGNIHNNTAPVFRVQLKYKDREDISTSGRLGVLQTENRLLCHVLVQYLDPQRGHPEYTDNIAAYYMQYETPQETTLFKSRLEEVVMLDSVHDFILDDICSLEAILHGDVRRNQLSSSTSPLRYHDGISASVTRYSYEDAPTINKLFSSEQSIRNTSNINVSSSKNTSWSIGGTATVGVGVNVLMTTFSGGGNYDYSRSKGECTTMLLDLNGDGLTDIVYEQGGKVYYKRQEKQGINYTFADQVVVPGLTRLSREVSNTHTWGTQLSFGVNLSYSNPRTTSYTDTYFSDVNADGLPDMIDGDHILINHLNNGVPTFVAFQGGHENRITVHNSNCGETILDGEVDAHIECEVIELLVDSISIEDFFGSNDYSEIGTEIVIDEVENTPDTHYYDGGIIASSQSDDAFDDIQSATLENPVIPIPGGPNKSQKSNNLPSEDSLIYRIENDFVKIYRLEYVCDTSKLDPEIETVRVWVASHDDNIHIDDRICLLEDTSLSRSRSIQADGVSYIIQYCQIDTNHVDESHLHATGYSILCNGTISPSDTTPHRWSGDLHIRKGDVLLFRLRSGDNHSFDRTKWSHVIRSGRNTSVIFDSQKDFVCSGDGHFQALNGNSSAILSLSGNNDGDIPVSLIVRMANATTTRNIIDTTLQYGTINLHKFISQIDANDSLFIVLSPSIADGREPHWGDICLHSKLEYISDFESGISSGSVVHDTIVYYPDVQIRHSSIYPSNSPYRKIFGTLHKGWGAFAYQDLKHCDTIYIDSLANTQLAAIELASSDTSAYSHNSTAESFVTTNTLPSQLDSTWNSQIDNIFSAEGIFNPIGKHSYWVPMRADTRTWEWVAYGDLGCIGKEIHSNAREIITSQDIEDIVEYDSSLPYSQEEGQKNCFVRKQSKSVQNSISWGVLAPINQSASFGTYETVVDYMDMNGDGYPDFVGKGGIQYSTPWGGIGKLISVKGYTPFKSSNMSCGSSFSASAILLHKTIGNNGRDGKFYLSASIGGSVGTGTSSTSVNYLDINADGLPDMVDTHNHIVRYNLGYGFSVPYAYNDVINEGMNMSENLTGSLSFSIGQVSISGGMGGSLSTDNTMFTLADINGDGLPDKIRATTSEVQVSFGMGINYTNQIIYDSWKSIIGINTISRNLTENFSTNLGVTGGFSFLGIVKFNCGIQSTPYSQSISAGEVMLTDMNGDGLVDYVFKTSEGLHVLYNKGGKANLLSSVTNPTGQEIRLSYELSDPSVDHRSRQWNLVMIEDVDVSHPSSGGNRHVLTMEYDSAYYDNYEKTDYGYHHVRTIENDERIMDEYYHNRTFLQNGELKEDILSDRDGHKYIRHVHGSRFVDIASHTVETDATRICQDANARVTQEGYWTEYYEKESDAQITTYHNIEYDQYHNIVRYVDEGDFAVHGDEWIQDITYLSNQANNMVSLPKEEIVQSASGSVIRRSSVNYNSKGKPAQIHLFASHTDDAVSHLLYDSYGNVTRIIFPMDKNGEHNWVSFDYDMVTFSHIVSIDNPYRVRTYTKYDYRWGVPLVVQDPSGTEIFYKYDYKGRLETVLAPIEKWQGNNYTVRYTYHLLNHKYNSQSPYPFMHVYKDMYDSLFVQQEVSIYDRRGRLLQKKHSAEVLGHDTLVVDGAEEWDPFGRAIKRAYPFLAQDQPFMYEPYGNSSAVVCYEYDVLDRPTLQVNADLTTRQNLYHFEPDKAGVTRLLTRTMDENGIETKVLKSPQDWIIQQEAGDSSRTVFEYSPIGELLSATDAEGYQTKYNYDMLGRLVHRIHPDAGETKNEYDLASNLIGIQTANLATTNEMIEYVYKFSRLQEIHYPHHVENNVSYLYDRAGRIAVREDGTGSEEFVYDQLGNVAQSMRRIVIPTESQAYVFRTLYKYDSFGRMRNIIYPDGEVVHYGYTTGGLLKTVVGTKNNNQNIYLWDRQYDEQGRKKNSLYGNNVWTNYSYDVQRKWLNACYTEIPGGDIIQDLHYCYDSIGNIRKIDQLSSYNLSPNFGGAYYNHYQYDRQYRLILSNGSGTFPYYFRANYSPSGRMGNKLTSTNPWTTDLLYGYDAKQINHQIRTAYDSQRNTMEFYWDANGNLAQIIGCKQNSARLHEWDEENRLKIVIGDKYVGYYGYDGNGERVYKLTGTGGTEDINYGSLKSIAVLEDGVLYPNPYLVVTNKGYTKHYYAGSERLATVIGSGGLSNMTAPIDYFNSPHDWNILKSSFSYYHHQDPFFHKLQHVGERIQTEDIDAKTHPELDYNCNPIILECLDVLSKQDILFGSIANNEKDNGAEQDVYYYHGDHLGSANWITDINGKPTQYLHYAPYGELMANESPSGYDERYKFTGKERDWESGYDFFGARFLWSDVGSWLSVDPLANKYPWISPYAYCAWNPVKYKDPDGRYFTISGDCKFESRANNLLSYLSRISTSLSNLVSSLAKNPDINIHIECSTDAVEYGEIKPSETKGMTKLIEGSNVINIYLPNMESGDDAPKDIFVANDYVSVNSIAAHELGHAEDLINGTYVKAADYNKAMQGDPIARQKCNQNERNAITYENEVRKVEHSEKRSLEYFKEN